MTVDQLILGTTNGDESVLNYLESLTDAQLEALFAPMFAVTRPVKSLRDAAAKDKIAGKVGGSSPKRTVVKKDLMADAQKKIDAMSPEKKALLAQFGLA